MQVLRWMCGYFRNKDICHIVQVVLIEDNMRENHLHWFDYLECKLTNVLISKKTSIEQDKKLIK